MNEHVESLVIPAGTVRLPGDLVIPSGALGLVLFAHGSGSSRRSSRNRFVARQLQRRRIGTLLFDLLTWQEEREDAIDGHLRFDIPMLAARLTAATDWMRTNSQAAALPVGYFGASTGAAAALIAAAERPELIRAVVSRGGRPDLAGLALPRVRAPTLLIVGSADETVLELNRAARTKMTAPVRLSIVPDATHLFPEPGALEEVAWRACEWFVEHFSSAAESTVAMGGPGR